MSEVEETGVTNTATLRSRASTLAPAIHVGEKIGRFSILSQIGAGGMGRIFEAYDPNLDRRIALKLLRDAGEDVHRQRLVREAQALARLEHPNVVTVHDVGTHQGSLFVAMEFVRGGTLKQWIGDNPVGSRARFDTAMRLLIDAGRGLMAAHQAGLVHRDVKPSNILIGDDGRARVADFGIARALDGNETRTTQHEIPQRTDEVLINTEESDSVLTRTGAAVGTPAYMAPEQFGSRSVSAAADQFAYCVTAWETLFGVRPFAGTNARALLHSIRKGDIRRPGDVDVNTAIETLIRRGLRHRPASRHHDLAELVHALETFATTGDTPRSRSYIRWGLILGGTAFLASFSAYRFGQNKDVCAGAEAAFAEVWNDRHRSHAGAVVLSTGPAFAPGTWNRVERGIDSYATRWIAAHRDACEATEVRREQTPERMDERIGCLEDGKRGVRALLKLLETGDADVLARAEQVLVDLPSVEACETTTGVRTSAEDAPVLQLVAQAASLRSAGRSDAALITIEQAVARLEESPSTGTRAKVLLEHGRSLAASARLRDSLPPLREAYTAAHSIGAATIATEAAIDIALRNDEVLGSADSVRTWLEIARSEGARSSDDHAYEFLRIEALLLRLQGDESAATAAYERSIDVAKVDPARHPHAVRRLAEHLGDRELDPARAVTLARRALELHAAYFGVEHPGAAVFENVLARNLSSAQQLEEAAVVAARGLQRTRAVVGSTHRDTSPYLVTQAHIACRSRDPARGVSLAEQAVALHSGRNDRALLSALYVRQQCVRQTNPQRAAVLAEELVLATSALYGEQHNETFVARAVLSEALLQSGRRTAAKEQLELATTLSSQLRGNNVRELVIAFSTLSTVASHLGDGELALYHARASAERLEQHNGGSIATRATTQGSLCSALRSLGRLNQALTECERGLKIALADGGSPLHVTRLEIDIAGLLVALHRDTLALEYFDSALPRWGEFVGLRSAPYSVALTDLARAEEHLDRPDEAEAHFREALEIQLALSASPYSPLDPGTGLVRMLARRGAVARATEQLAELEGFVTPSDLRGRAQLAETRGYVFHRRRQSRARDRAYSRAVVLFRLAGAEDQVQRVCAAVDLPPAHCTAN